MSKRGTFCVNLICGCETPQMRDDLYCTVCLKDFITYLHNCSNVHNTMIEGLMRLYIKKNNTPDLPLGEIEKRALEWMSQVDFLQYPDQVNEIFLTLLFERYAPINRYCQYRIALAEETQMRLRFQVDDIAPSEDIQDDLTRFLMLLPDDPGTADANLSWDYWKKSDNPKDGLKKFIIERISHKPVPGETYLELMIMDSISCKCPDIFCLERFAYGIKHCDFNIMCRRIKRIFRAQNDPLKTYDLYKPLMEERHVNFARKLCAEMLLEQHKDKNPLRDRNIPTEAECKSFLSLFIKSGFYVDVVMFLKGNVLTFGQNEVIREADRDIRKPMKCYMIYKTLNVEDMSDGELCELISRTVSIPEEAIVQFKMLNPCFCQIDISPLYDIDINSVRIETDAFTIRVLSPAHEELIEKIYDITGMAVIFDLLRDSLIFTGQASLSIVPSFYLHGKDQMIQDLKEIGIE